jgi:hypothetical protein
MRCSKIGLALAAAFLIGPGLANAQDHVVSIASADARLAKAADGRAHDLATLRSALDRPEAARAAASVGADLGLVRSALPTLSDGELRDLAARAAALQGDPAAGLDHDIEQLLIVFLIVGIVIIVIQAVD